MLEKKAKSLNVKYIEMSSLKRHSTNTGKATIIVQLVIQICLLHLKAHRQPVCFVTVCFCSEKLALSSVAI